MRNFYFWTLSVLCSTLMFGVSNNSNLETNSSFGAWYQAKTLSLENSLNYQGNFNHVFFRNSAFAMSDYCIPSATVTSRYINNFTTEGGHQSVSNLDSGFSPDGYGDFTDMVVEQGQGGAVNFSVNVSGGSAGFRIWVDWNQDGTFAADEVAFQTSSYSLSHSGSFEVPQDAMLGSTRMRIVSHWLSTTGDIAPCATGFLYGEFEDYTFIVTDVSAYDCPVLEANIGAACDDGNPNTNNDTVNEDCECVGIPAADNDEACDATALTCGDVITQSLIGASSSIEDSCNGSGSSDVWFSFVVDGTQKVTVAETSSFDAIVQLFIGDDCGNLVEAGACSDITENYTVTEPGTYYFRVRPYSSLNNEAEITVSLTCEDFDCSSLNADIGDSCDDGDPNTLNDVITEDCECQGTPLAENNEACNATEITCGEEISQSLVGAVETQEDTCYGSGTADVWFSFTTDGTQLYTIAETSAFDAVVQLFMGDDCGNLIEVGACSDFNEYFTVSDAGTYYFKVRPYYSSGNSGNITVSLTCEGFDCQELSANIGDACDDGNPNTANDVVTEDCECVGVPAPVDNSCANPIALACGEEPVTYSSASSTNISPDGCSIGNNGLWFSFEGTGAAITITSMASFDHKMSMQTGSCDDLTFIACKDGTINEEIYTLESTVAGEMYYVYIAHYSSYTNATGSISVSIDCAEVPDCTAPTLSLTTQDANGDEIDCLDADGEFFVVASLSGGSGNDNYSLSANGGEAVEVAADASHTFGPFAAGTDVEVVATGVEDNLCSVTEAADAPANCPPVNETCDGAIALECNAEPVTYSSAGSSATSPSGCNLGNNGIWFSFEGTGADISIVSSASFDHEMSINTGTCDALVNVGCKDSSTGEETYTVEDTVEGQMYYVYIAHWNVGSTTTGTITIAIECEEVVVDDVVAPTVVTQDVTVELDENGMASISADEVNNGSSDDVTTSENLVMSLDVTSFDCSNVGENTVTLTVTDEAGNSATGTAVVTVEDNLAPVITTEDLMIGLEGNASVSIMVEDVATATDNCGGDVTITLSQDEFTELGEYTVTVTATDANGNTSTETVTVTVVETMGVNDFASRKGVEVYPNPSSDFVQIKSDVEVDFVQVYSLTGQLVKTVKSNKVDLRGFVSGNYVLKVQTKDGGQVSKKLIVK
ncbi:GEVED domain-containing protein [Weeksellaceae bacterium KMM 9724]|uniref:GEVED domain-containing protein n=1 Tax=Profundicola chukchiensis TaxID=2961959 RepID=UPI00243CCC7D|nr:GEVED domain-containing protein [Profundicola chukchiensis]MDG4951333.1 GEVED domain-containing protein [Profundicola chukchiensis]